MPIQIAYWKIRGLAQAIRLLLEYCGEQYEDTQFECGPAPDYSRECWTSVKHTLGLDFPNLPYLIDGDVKITQSNAILRYIARRHNLCGSSVIEQAKVDMLCDTVMDFRNGAVRVFYNPKFNELRASYIEGVKKQFLKPFSDLLGNNPWIAGKNLTFVDFHLYELLDQHKVMEPTILADFPNLAHYQDRFQELSAMKKYMSSERFLKHPINNPMAGFVGN